MSDLDELPTGPGRDAASRAPVNPDTTTPRSTRTPARTRLRPVQGDDHEAVQALFRRHGWPLRSRAGWDWALIDSPARTATGADAGWVLEHGDDVVGFLGNLPLAYRLDGLAVWGATCTSYLVDEPHRAHSTRLLRAFAAQPGPAFVFSATANPHSAPVYRAFRFQPSPQPRANQRLRWIASEPAAAALALSQRGLGLLAPLGHALAAVPMSWRLLREAMCRPSPADGLHVERLSSADLSGERAAHWPRVWNAWALAYWSRPGLWIDRGAATAAWRLADPDGGDRLALWAVRDGDGRMLGMCSVRELPGQRRAEFLDWAVLPSAPPAAAARLHAEALRWARQRGLAVLDAKRWTGEAATQLEALTPRRAALPADGVWLLSHERRELPSMLPWPAWSMTGVDSDDWFNSHLSTLGAEGPRWATPPQATSEASSSRTRSATDSTSDGSNRSMSTA